MTDVSNKFFSLSLSNTNSISQEFLVYTVKVSGGAMMFGQKHLLFCGCVPQKKVIFLVNYGFKAPSDLGLLLMLLK